MAEEHEAAPNEEQADLGPAAEVNEADADTEAFEKPDHLDTELAAEDPMDKDYALDDEDELNGDDASVEDALRAWVAGGRVIEDDDDAVLPVQFAQLEPPIEPPPEPDTDRLNNVHVNVTVELGRKEMTVQELVNMKEQDVIDLAKLAGEAFDIRINNRLFAEGEIVVVTDVMAVRITRLRPTSTDQANPD